MYLDEPKFKILRQLAVVTEDAWPDYLSQYGFTETDVPALLELYSDDKLIGSDADTPDSWALIHTWRILGQLHCEQAIAPMIASFDHLYDKPIALNELSQVFGMIGPKAIEPLDEYLQQLGKKNELSYGLALDALYEIARAFPDYRIQIITIFQRYMAKPQLSMPTFNGLFVKRLIDLDAKETIDDIRKLFALNCVDEHCAGDLETVEIKLGCRTKRYGPTRIQRIRAPATVKSWLNRISNDDSGNPEDDGFNIIDHWLMLLGSDKSILGVSELDGYFAAIVCSPTTILPSVWMTEIWGGETLIPDWESDEVAERFKQAVFDLYNSVRADLNEANYEPVFLENTKDMKALPLVDHWCRGFIRGLVLWPKLLPDDRLYLNKCILPIQIFGTEQGAQSLDSRRIEDIAKLQQDITPNVLKLYRHFNTIENHQQSR